MNTATEDSFLNPTLRIFEYRIPHKNIALNVIRDDLLQGGTKQRAMVEYLDKKGKEEFVYTGPVCGMAQLALATACKSKGKKCTLILSRQPDGKLHNITEEAKNMGANVIISDRVKGLKDLRSETEKYLSKNEQAFLVPFGASDEDYISSLRNSVKKALKRTILEHHAPKRLWVVAGSTTLLNVLAGIWPETHFMVLQVGKKVWPDQRGYVDGKVIFKSTLYIAEEKFYEKARQPPPYPSNANYDAKLWKFLLQHAECGDVVWNVA